MRCLTCLLWSVALARRHQAALGVLPLRCIFLILAPSGFHIGWTGPTMQRSFSCLLSRRWSDRG